MQDTQNEWKKRVASDRRLNYQDSLKLNEGQLLLTLEWAVSNALTVYNVTQLRMLSSVYARRFK
jgi:hypothetical protein